MPVHDWSCVPTGIFQDFRHGWIADIAHRLNGGLLPSECYALKERLADGLCLHAPTPPDDEGWGRLIGRSEMDVYRHRQNSIVVRRAHDDRAVAVIEVASPANKTTADALEAFVRSANDALEHGVHLLIIDLFRPGRHDPRGIHAAIWDRIQARSDPAVPGKSLTLVAYESDIHMRAYVEPIAVGDILPEMPFFLEPGQYVEIPLEDTYRSAWDAFPRRWKAVLESPR